MVDAGGTLPAPATVCGVLHGFPASPTTIGFLHQPKDSINHVVGHEQREKPGDDSDQMVGEEIQSGGEDRTQRDFDSDSQNVALEEAVLDGAL